MDWRKIKKEYITTDTSYRKLCDKYGVSYKALSKRAKDEGWPKLRNQADIKTTSKIIDAHADQQAENARLLQATATGLLSTIAEGLGKLDPDELLADRRGLRGITGALKDLKEVLFFSSELNIDEKDTNNLFKAITKVEEIDTDDLPEVE